MTQITPTDQVLLLLREQLQRSDRVRSRKVGPQDERPATRQQRIEALAAVKDLPPRDFRRALVRSLLSERLGEQLVADPAFEAVTGEVLRMIEESDEGRDLLDKVAAGFRGD